MSAKDCKYLESHEWARRDGDLVVVGITDVAVEQLSDLVFVDLPNPGVLVTQGEAFGEIESVKAVSELLSPVTGEVVEVNEELADDLDRLAKSPFEDGWMIKVRPDGDGGWSELLSAEDYAKVAAEGGH
ncbi:MAG: glycine cleavage system protein GcvH [Planctomycetota bacterium]